MNIRLLKTIYEKTGKNIILVLLLMVTQGAWALSGSGTQTDPYLLYTNQVINAEWTNPINYKLPGAFSVSSNKVVYFSKGNLQYQASNNIWRMAEHQYDYVGDATHGNVYENEVKCDNANISSTYTGWIDLFGWATSGNSASGTAYQPWSTSTTNSDYGTVSSGEWTAANSDWGVVNAAQLGSGWRTLTHNEWVYLINTRTNASNLRTFATVNGVVGLILMPDGWTANVVSLAITTSNYTTNIISLADWNTLESQGCVFLPSAGYRGGDNNTTCDLVQSHGSYWSSTAYNYADAYYLDVKTNGLDPSYHNIRHTGLSVRLVSESYFAGSGTAEDPYLIHSEAEWNYLADQVAAGNTYSGKYFRQTADIGTEQEPITRMVGIYSGTESNRRPFSGTFDGQGHILTVDYSGNDYETRTAPFSFASCAAIKNLIVTGNCGTAGRAAGIVGESDGTTTTVTNCVSSVTISGGLVGGIGLGGNVDIRGCLFNGTINGESQSGGLVGWGVNTTKITNCLFAPQAGSSINGCTFYYTGSDNGGATITNSYYTTALGTAQGKQARSITAGIYVTVYDLGEGTEYDVSGITAYAHGIKYNGAYYAGDGDAVSLTLSHDEAPEGYYFSQYAVTGGGMLANPTTNSPTLTMTDANQEINIEWAAITQTFNYTGAVQTFTVPATGYYTLECYGAQGGYSSSGLGGKGGWSQLIYPLTQGDVLYIYVGGQGGCIDGSISHTEGGDGGWNGGGKGGTGVNHYTGSGPFDGGGGGGGATHIATSDVGPITGSTDFTSNHANLILIAGGGGGGLCWSSTAGGTGGGAEGGKGKHGSSEWNIAWNNGTLSCGKDGMISSNGSESAEGCGGGGAGYVGGNTWPVTSNADKQSYSGAGGSSWGETTNGINYSTTSGGATAGGNGKAQITLLIQGSGTEENPYLIPSVDAWNFLADQVSAGNNYSGKFFRQTADISVTKMVGTGSGDDATHSFCGTYDGDGHTLTFNIEASEDLVAPFRYINGATIKNLIVDGANTSSARYNAGLVALSDGAVTISNCVVSTTLTNNVVSTNWEDGNSACGGFIAEIHTGSVTFNGCRFSGSILGSANSFGGFVGWSWVNDSPAKEFNDCLFAPIQLKENVSDTKTYCRDLEGNVTLNNSYYLTAFGTSQGKQAYSITGGTGVTVANAVTPTNYYNVSGITAYGTGILYDGKLYSGEGDVFSLNLSGGLTYTATTGTLSGTANPYSMTLANANSVINFVPIASVTVGETTTNYPTFASAVSAWVNNSTLTLLADVETASTITVNSTCTLDLNGYGLTRTGNNGGVINLSSGANFTLKDSDPTKEHKFTISNPKANGAGKAMVNDALTSGYETFTGGYITGGYNNGGAGVLMSGGTFIMNGGTFIGNDADRGSGNRLGWGGAVEVKYGTFTMNGGAMIGNIARYGGGLSVHNDGWDTHNSNANKGSATINNGLIKYNFSSNHSGGIHTDGANYIHITGGTIINNYTVGNHNSDVGGGLIISNGTPGAIAGSVIVRGNQSENDGPNNNININVASAQTQAFDLTGGFNSDADVYVYAINWTPSSADAKIAYNATLNDIKYIHSDNADGAGVIFFDGSRDWVYDSSNDEFLPISRTNKHQYNLSQANTIWLSTNASTTHLPDNLAFTLTLASDGNGTAVVKTPLPTGVTNNQNGSYAVDNNTELQLEASPATDYHFVQWQDNNSNNPRTITVTENATYTATFAIDEYRIDSIPTSWQVKIGEGDPFAPTPYGDEHPDSGYVMIPVGSEFVIIPSEDQKHLVSKLELIEPIIDLSLITANTTVQDGWTITGTLNNNVKISIADGATVTLNGATINGVHDWSYQWAGLNCIGDATIILSGDNTVKGFHGNYPGIHVPSGKTLTIQGTGSLDASSNDIGAAGIGGGWSLSCGNIIINGGTITAIGGDVGIGSGRNGSSCGAISINGGTVTATGSNGGAGIGSGMGSTSSCGAISISGGTVTATTTCSNNGGAGIGSGLQSSCGAITISGGTVEATGCNAAAGIGTGYLGTCADGITIMNTVTRVTATKGSNNAESIGAGISGSCGTVTIGGVTGAISTSPYTYIPGAISGKFSVSSTKQVYFSQGNLQYQASTSTWQFAAHQYDNIGADNRYISSSYSGWIDLFGWGTSGYDHGATCYQPWSSSTTNTDYYPYNSATANLYDGDGKADWGYNAISNGGNTENCGWRTLKKDEWLYLFNSRTTTSGIRYAKATVNGVTGIILLPDDWSTTYYSLSNTNVSNAAWTSNTITAADWTNNLEKHGAVFLPTSGNRDGANPPSSGFVSCWSSEYKAGDPNNAHVVYIPGDSVYPDALGQRSTGNPVRLVRDAN